MLSSTDNNFMIFLFDFERLRIESRFPFLKLTLYTFTRKFGISFKWYLIKYKMAVLKFKLS